MQLAIVISEYTLRNNFFCYVICNISKIKTYKSATLYVTTGNLEKSYGI